MQDQVVLERMEQLALKEEREKRDRFEEQLFADLWHEDMMAKVKKKAPHYVVNILILASFPCTFYIVI